MKVHKYKENFSLSLFLAIWTKNRLLNATNTLSFYLPFFFLSFSTISFFHFPLVIAFNLSFYPQFLILLCFLVASFILICFISSYCISFSSPCFFLFVPFSHDSASWQSLIRFFLIQCFSYFPTFPPTTPFLIYRLQAFTINQPLQIASIASAETPMTLFELVLAVVLGLT